MRARHPWEIARAACILDLIQGMDFELVADIGAGDLYFAQELHRRHPGRLIAVDTGYGYPTERDGILLLNSLSQLGNQSLDMVLLMDVLEHVPDDRQLLEEVLRKVKPGGHVLITVPAFPFLFWAHDRVRGHFRRYRRRQLHALLRGLQAERMLSFYFFAAPFLFSAHDRVRGHFRRYRRRQLHALLRGLQAERMLSFYFFAAPFLVRCLQRLLPRLARRRRARGIAAWRLGEDHLITRGLVALLRADFSLGRRLAEVGIPWPGLSICLIIRKRSAS